MQQGNVDQSSFLSSTAPEQYRISPAMKTLLVPVYREPDENAPLLKRLPADTTVTVIARAAPWLFIQFAP